MENSNNETIQAGKLTLKKENVILNPNDNFYIDYLRPYYIQTKDGQYLFGSHQKGRRPDRAFYMVPDGYKVGKKQQLFDKNIGLKFYETVLKYLTTVKTIVQDGIQGQDGYEVGLRVTFSVDNPMAAYIAWKGKQMVFPPKKGMSFDCFNYVVMEELPEPVVKEVREYWPDYDPKVPITLYDFTEMDNNVRRVMSVGVDYFGGAFKKPHLTMVWNKGESEGLVSYHAGCTKTRVMKGLSGTGKTTLSVGSDLEQDDALFGKPEYGGDKINHVQLIGLEAASFAKSEGLKDGSPEWPGLMKSKEVNPDGSRPIVLAMNIDCEGVKYENTQFGKYTICLPVVKPGQEVGHLTCTNYQESGTTNGRFIFLFSELNPNWGNTGYKELKAEALSFKRFDVLEPGFRVTDPTMAVALDSACESIITSAIAAQKAGTRVRSYAATDFMIREQSQQTLLKKKMYGDLGLGDEGKLVFFINNAGMVGESDLEGDQVKKVDEKGNPVPVISKETGKQKLNDAGEPMWVGQGEKISVNDSKTLVDLMEHRKIKNWIKHPAFGYLLPEPKELEEVHGLKDFGKRFNMLRFYTPEQILEFYKRDIKERTEFLEWLFNGQEGYDELQDVINVWKNCKLPSPEEIREFYETHYGKV